MYVSVRMYDIENVLLETYVYNTYVLYMALVFRSFGGNI